jgi:hypothetical protein
LLDLREFDGSGHIGGIYTPGARIASFARRQTA